MKQISTQGSQGYKHTRIYITREAKSNLTIVKGRRGGGRGIKPWRSGKGLASSASAPASSSSFLGSLPTRTIPLLASRDVFPHSPTRQQLLQIIHDRFSMGQRRQHCTWFNLSFLPFIELFSFFFFYRNGQHESTGRHTRVAREVTSTLSAGRRCNNARIGLGPLRADCSARGTPAGRLANAPGPRSCRETTVTAARAIAWTRRAIVRGVSGRSRGLQGRKTYWCVSRHSCSNLGCLLGIAFSTLYSCFTFGEARD